MSFKFDFQLDEDELDNDYTPSTISSSHIISDENQAGPSRPRISAPSIDIDLEDLLDTLPESISYSPILIPGLERPLLRRDLYDARFQLMSQEPSKASPKASNGKPRGLGNGDLDDGNDSSKSPDDEEEYVDAATDLIPGIYEGGLKTWEGGVDLVEVLNASSTSFHSSQPANDDLDSGVWFRGSRVLELGCGTALPSAFILRSFLEASSHSEPELNGEMNGSSELRRHGRGQTTTLHLQDYNLSVLQLVTLPNLLLASLPFLPSSAFETDDSETPNSPIDHETGNSNGDPELNLVFDEAGEIGITPILKKAFLQLLEDHDIQLKFTYGGWEDLSKRLAPLDRNERECDLILTAETIYSQESVGPLLDVLTSATRPPRSVVKQTLASNDLEKSIESLRLSPEWMKNPLKDTIHGVVMVAAKVLYFGVGGGLQAFLHLVEEQGGEWEVVKEWTQGVGRKVIKVAWTKEASR